MLLVILLLLPQVAEAIAIAPGTADFVFAPNAVNEFELHVINNDAKAADVTLYVKGDLADYVQLPANSLALKPNEERIVNVKLALPATPVSGSARIGAATKVSSGDGVGAMVAVESRVTVSSAAASSARQASLGQQSAKLELLGVSITKTADGGTLDISVANNGGAGIEAYAEANIEADTGRDSVTTSSKVVPANGKQTLSAPISKLLASANDYKADVVIYYEGNSVKKSVRFGSGITGGATANVFAGMKVDYVLIVAILAVVSADIIALFWRRIFKRKP